MAKCLFLLILFFVSITYATAQDFDNYQQLESTGKIPKDFLIPSSVKYEKELQKVDTEESKRTQKDEKQFYLESNFLIDNLLQSGKVLFNDPITDYINQVADEVLKDDPTLRKKIRIYAVRSSAVNAFATNQGLIFVNVGLIAQLETEAQLAFILAHEISHVKHGHALDMFLEAREIDRSTSRSDIVQRSTFDDKLVAKNYFSKELEEEADKIGLDLYLATNYNLKDIDGVFDVLHYSYLPFDIDEFETSFLETSTLDIPDSTYCEVPKDEVNPIMGFDEDEDNPKSSHPSIGSRRRAAAKMLSNQKNSGRKSYLATTPKEFEKMRDICRFELCYYYLHQFNYQAAIYSAFLLSKKYPDSKYLKKIVVKSLYGFAKFKNEIKGLRPYSVTYADDDIYLTNMRKSAYKDIEGSLQKLYYMLAQMSEKELTVLATRHTWDALAQHPDDKELQDIRKDIFTELAYHYESRSEFSAYSIFEINAQKDSIAQAEKEAAKDSTQTDKQEKKKLSKYDKIKKTKNIAALDPTSIDLEGFAKYAFSDVVTTDKFRKWFKEGKEEKEEINKRIEFYNSSEGRAVLRKRRNRKATALGIDSVLVISPYYLKVYNGIVDTKIKYLQSEKNQQTLSKLIEKNARLAKVDVTVLDVANMQETDAKAFNQLRLLKEWMSQQNRFGSNLLMKGFNQEQIDAIRKKYKKKYMLFTGVIALKRVKTRWMLWSILFDLETGRYQVIKEGYYNRKDSKPALNAHLYDAFFQIKATRKKS